jgi:hypothetical protein
MWLDVHSLLMFANPCNVQNCGYDKLCTKNYIYIRFVNIKYTFTNTYQMQWLKHFYNISKIYLISENHEQKA